jgi:hypothetical protein
MRKKPKIKTENLSLKKALQMLKDNKEDLIIKIKQGTIYQSQGWRYFIDFKGNIKYCSDGIVRSVKV